MQPEINPYASPQVPSFEPTTRLSPVVYAFPYESSRTRAMVITVCFCAVIAFKVWMVYLDQITWDKVQVIWLRGGATPAEQQELVRMEQMVGQAAMGFILVALVGGIAWLMWVHRTYRNLPALGNEGLKHSPGWAVGYYFIPIVSFYRPLQVMIETAKGSNPAEDSPNPNQSGVAAPMLLLVSWWVLHIVSGFAGIFTRISLERMKSLPSKEAFSQLYNAGMTSHFSEILASVFALLVVWRIQKHQDQKYQRLRYPEMNPAIDFGFGNQPPR